MYDGMNECVKSSKPQPRTMGMDPTDDYGAPPDQLIGGKRTQWSTTDDRNFIPTGRSSTTLSPGAYTIKDHNGQIYFEKFEVKTSDLLLLPGTVLGEVVDEINKFWDLYDHYKSFGINHRRGILIGGPAGSGKSSTLKLVGANVIERGGIIVPYENPHLLIAGITAFREIQPATPIVVMMENYRSGLIWNLFMSCPEIKAGLTKLGFESPWLKK